MKKPRLVCIGDLMLDVVVRPAGEIAVGTDTPGSVRFHLGGSAGNTCRSFVRLGGKAALVCAAGDDGLSRRLIDAHRFAGVAVHAVRVRGATPRLLAMIGPTGERSFVTDRGVADEIHSSDLKDSWFSRADAIHLPAYSLLASPIFGASLSARATSIRKNGKAIASVDLASSQPLLAAGVDASLSAVKEIAPDVLFANIAEVTALVGRRGARQLLDIAPTVVVKQGGGGCRVAWRGDRARSMVDIQVATKPLSAVDTTGAGDAFDAGFIYSLLSSGFHGGDVPSAQALRRAALDGHRAAALVLTESRPELAL